MAGLTEAITAALLYASIHSGLSIPKDAPLVQIEITAWFEGSKLGKGGRFWALTSRKNGHVAVWPGFDFNDPFSQCVLTHELVHYLQFSNKILGTASVNEPPAYRVEAQCHHEHGNQVAETEALEYAKKFEDLAK